MSIVRREYNPQTRELRQVGGTMGGAAGDNSAVTIQFTYPENYLEDKDAYIAFNVFDRSKENLYWFSFNGEEFTIPYTVIADATRNKLRCQIILIRKTNTNYVEYSRVSAVMFIRPDLSYPMVEAESVDAVTDLAQLREMTSEIIVDALDEIKEYIQDHLGESQSGSGGLDEADFAVISAEIGSARDSIEQTIQNSASYIQSDVSQVQSAVQSIPIDTLSSMDMTLSGIAENTSTMASEIDNVVQNTGPISTMSSSIDQVLSDISEILTGINQLSERIQLLETKIDNMNEVR